MKAFFTVLQPQIAADYIFYATILQNIISYVSGRKPTSFSFFSGSVKEDFRKTFDLLYHCVLTTPERNLNNYLDRVLLSINCNNRSII